MKSLLQGAATFFLLLPLVGCGSGPTVVQVTGVATRGGKPVKNLFLSFNPEDGTQPSTGMTDEQGRFELKIRKGQKGVTVGTHKVVATFRPRSPQEEVEYAERKLKYHPEQDAILEKYGNRETTAMTVEIVNSSTDLELKFD